MIYVISDIHGNYEALKVFFSSIKKTNKDQIYCLGDIVGYYYQANECLNLLRKHKVIVIKGNHEINFIKSMKNKNLLNKYCEKYGNSYRLSIKNISSKNKVFLKKLSIKKKIRLNNFSILFAHGAPWKNDEYIYENRINKFKKKFRKYKFDICFLGHTHRRMNCLINNKLIVNPGSIGQPRDKLKGKASWVEFDEKKKSIHFKNKKYNTTKLKKQIKLYDRDKFKFLSKYF